MINYIDQMGFIFRGSQVVREADTAAKDVTRANFRSLFELGGLAGQNSLQKIKHLWAWGDCRLTLIT